MAKVCVDCQKEVNGKRAVKVKEDRIILALRAAKRALKISRENELFICEDCFEKHEKRRKSFEKTMLIFAVVAALIIVLMVFTIILSGRLELWAILSGILIIALLAVFSIIFKYVPATDGTEMVLISGKPTEQKPVEKKPVEKKSARKKKGGK